MKGQTLSHYRVLEMVGQGASGVIYKAEDLALGRLVALKGLPSDLPATGTDMLRFQHEARTASSINHPNICTIHDIGEHEGRQFIVMEWLEGRTLADLIDRRPLKLENLLDYAIQIADGLHAAHALGIVHRDVKPSNILITKDGHAKILDFGISVLVTPGSSSQPSDGTGLVGTVCYMSPEQVRGGDLDPRSDLFSLGIVLYEMATGRRPFIAGTVEELTQLIVDRVPDPPCMLNPDIPAELDRIVMKALEQNRKLRFQTAADLRADLQRLKRDFESGALRVGAKPASVPIDDQKLAGATLRPRIQPAAVIALAGITSVFIGLIASHLMAPAGHPDTSSRSAGVDPVRRTDILLSSQEESPVRTPAAGVAMAPAGGSAGVPPINVELSVAQKKADAGLHDQALETLQAIVTRYGAAPESISAYFLMGSVQEAQGKHEDAMATYLEIAHRFKGHRRGAEALYRFAEVTLKSRRADKEAKARNALEQLVAAYRDDFWTPRALLMKAGIEERKRLYERDVRLAADVPSALVSYRQLTSAYPNVKGADIAFEKLAKLYEELERYDLAAATFVELGKRYPSASPDAWYRAGELYRRRLNDSQMARSAYANVPKTSRYFKDAQNRLR
jgi:serine/threonine protein kinase